MSTPKINEAARAATPTASEPTPTREIGNPSMTQPCIHCTVPVDVGNVCTFCKHYTPPPVSELPNLASMAAEMAEIFSRAVSRTSDHAPLFAVVDMTAAVAHCRQAARLLSRAAARINQAAVTR